MWQTVGQEKAVALLQRGLERQSLAHAYLLTGPSQVGKMTLARDLAKALNCEAAAAPCGECPSCRKIEAGKHSDIQIIELGSGPDETRARAQTEISIDSIRELQHAASLPPFEGNCKVFIIDGAEFMSHEAANCLLKTLEEPVAKVVFILLSARERAVPATIISRCQRVELIPLSLAETETELARRDIATDRAELLAHLAHGRLGWAITATQDEKLLQERSDRLEKIMQLLTGDLETRFEYAAQLASQFGQNRETVYEALAVWLDFWRDLLLLSAGCGELITNRDLAASLGECATAYRPGEIRDFINHLQRAETELKQNANPQLVLEVLMLDIPQGRQIRNG